MRKTILLAFSIVLLAACGAAPTPTPTPVPTPTRIHATPIPALTVSILPDAEQSFRKVSGRAPFTVEFSAEVAGGTPPFSYAWDMDGDGVSDSEVDASAAFTFEVPNAYDVSLVVKDAAGQTADATRRIVAFGTPQTPEWKYGVTAHLERRSQLYYPTLGDAERATQLIQEAGIQAVRMDFNWDMLNPTPDEWKFEDYDRVVDMVREHDLEFLGIIDYVSWWASSAQDSQDFRVRLYSEPLNDYDFASYTYQVVDHFKDRVKVWQIWNEPNTVGFWQPKPNPTRYVSLLQEAYLAAKYADPNAFVMFAGLSSNGIEGNDNSGLVSNFIADAYAAGAQGYFDAMAIHPYMLPNGGIEALRGKIEATRALMDAQGDADVPLWLTEIGVPTDAPWWQTAPLQSEADAAQWLRQIYTQLWDLTPTIFWYQLEDREIGDDPEGHFGLVRSDLSPKPAYQMLKELTSEGE